MEQHGDLIDAGVLDGETIRLTVKPNAFLYTVEATRSYLLIMLAMVALLVPYVHFRTGLQIGLATQIALIVCGVLAPIFFIVVMIGAHCMAFLITDKKVIARMSIMGRIDDKISIPIKSIENIEVRSYNALYGSVYLKCYKESRDRGSRSDTSDGSHPASLHRPVIQPRPLAIVRPGRASIWLSMPWSSPPLAGFYGFGHFEAFVSLIIERQAAARKAD
jgi:hypothetical protein